MSQKSWDAYFVNRCCFYKILKRNANFSVLTKRILELLRKIKYFFICQNKFIFFCDLPFIIFKRSIY